MGKIPAPSVSHVPYVSKHKNNLVILMPNGNTLQLHMRDSSSHTQTTYLYLCQIPELRI